MSMVSQIHFETGRRPASSFLCIAFTLFGLQLLHPVESFAPSPVTPTSWMAQRQRSSETVLIRSRSLQNGALFSGNASTGDSVASNGSNPVRKVTGLSLTAVRATLRSITGFSLTTLRATLRAATGISLSQQFTSLVSSITGFLPAGVRYFLQPFLIMYYAPMMIVRYYMVGPSRKYVEESQKGHERVVEGWRRAVEAAEKAQEGGYWPVHLNEDGSITASLPPDPDQILDVVGGIEKSVELEQELAQNNL